MIKTPLRLVPLTSTIGVSVHDVDFRALDERTVAALRAALLEHRVLVLPNQTLTPEEHLAAVSRFGEPEPHAVAAFFGRGENVVVVDEGLIALPDPDRAPQLDDFVEFDGWHTDYSFARRLPEFGSLRAQTLPPIGGDTAWVDMVAAYAALSPAMQAFLSQFDAEHAPGLYFPDNFGITARGPDEVQRFRAEFTPVRHPVVVRHPETGEHALFVNPAYTKHLIGLSADESRTLLRFLFRHVTKARFMYRHHWRVDDLVMWDQRSTIHLAPSDFHPHARRLVPRRGRPLHAFALINPTVGNKGVSTSLNGTSAVVFDGDAPLGSTIAGGLIRLGAAVTIVRSSGGPMTSAPPAGARECTADLTDPAQVESVFSTAGNDGPIETVVYAAWQRATATAASFNSLSERAWIASCEEPILSWFLVCQAARRHFRSGGSLVLVAPTVAITGAAGHVAMGAAAEAQRVFGKSMARIWGEHGISVNFLLLDAVRLVAASASDPDGALLARPAHRRAAARPLPENEDDVLRAIEYLVSDGRPTGATISLDGGALMAP